MTRKEISDAVHALGWRYVLGALRAMVPLTSLAQAGDLATRLLRELGAGAEGSLRLDLRPDALLLTLTSHAESAVTPHEIALARKAAAVVAESGLRLTPGPQAIEIAIDTADADRIRPFWQAVLAYAPGPEGDDSLVDPLGQSPPVWFQRMTGSRPQRNRVHLDISVPHDHARPRIEAALEAGGALVSDTYAPAFWVLADAEGNEACVSTWEGRD